MPIYGRNRNAKGKILKNRRSGNVEDIVRKIMPSIIQFVFLYVVLPYCAVIALGVFSCPAARGNVENSERADYPLTAARTWLALAFPAIVGVFWFFKSTSSMTDLLSSEIVVGSYFLGFVILILCALVFVVIRLILGLNKPNDSPPLRSSPVLISFGVIAVLSTLYASTLVVEFFNRAFIIAH